MLLAFKENMDNEAVKTKVYQSTTTTELQILRIISMIVLHLQVSTQVRQSLFIMKYSVNHEYRFSDPTVAFLSGFVSFVTVILIEICNVTNILEQLSVILIFKSTLTFSLIYNFNSFFFGSMTDPISKVYVTNPEFAKVLRYEVTTSDQARVKNEHHKFVKGNDLL